MDETFTMLAPSCPSKSVANSWVGSSVPRKFRLNTNSTPLGSKLKNVAMSVRVSSPSSYVSFVVVARGLLPPAPLINQVHGPKMDFTFLWAACKELLSSTSHPTARARPPYASIEAATFCAASSFLSSKATLAPHCARA